MFSDPQKNIEQFKLGEGMQVADLGAGSGFYSLVAARRVGTEGRVYTIDIQEPLLTRVQTQAQEEGLGNIEIIRGDLEVSGGSKLRDNAVDAAMVANILFQIQHKDVFVSEVFRIVRQGGKVLVVDWTDSFGGLGPTQDHIFSEIHARALFEKAGFSFVESISAGEHHYGLVFRKS